MTPTYDFSGIDAVRQTKGVAEAAICYTGDLSAPNGGGKYNLEYYLNLAQVSACAKIPTFARS